MTIQRNSPNVKNSLLNVKNRIKQACRSNHINPEKVCLLAVSKTKPAQMIEACYEAGQTSFGENYLQDALPKIDQLNHLQDINWHFIGPLQSNKTRAVAENFHWVETLDREKIALRLNEQRPEGMPALNVLIQVNISQEQQKNGIPPKNLLSFSQFVTSLPKLNLRGIMCIPESTADQEMLRAQFEQMYDLWSKLNLEIETVDTLSMGMSSDMELAISCGSTQVRIGTDIFGAR